MEKARYTTDFIKRYEEENLRLLEFQKQLALEGLNRIANIGDLQDVMEVPAPKRQKTESTNFFGTSLECKYDQRNDENSTVGRDKERTSCKRSGKSQRKPLVDKYINRSSLASDETAQAKGKPCVEGVDDVEPHSQRSEEDLPHSLDTTKVAATPVAMEPTFGNSGLAAVGPTVGPPVRMTRSRARVLENAGATTPAISGVGPPPKKQRRGKCNSRSVPELRSSQAVVDHAGTDDTMSETASLHRQSVAANHDGLEGVASAQIESSKENQSKLGRLSPSHFMSGDAIIHTAKPDSEGKQVRGDKDGASIDHSSCHLEIGEGDDEGTNVDHRVLAPSLDRSPVKPGLDEYPPSESFRLSSGAVIVNSPIPRAEDDARDEDISVVNRTVSEMNRCTDASNMVIAIRSPVQHSLIMESNSCNGNEDVDGERQLKVLSGTKSFESDLSRTQTLPDVEGPPYNGGLAHQVGSVPVYDSIIGTGAMTTGLSQDRVKQREIDPAGADLSRHSVPDAGRHLPKGNAKQLAIEEEAPCLNKQESFGRETAEFGIAPARSKDCLSDLLIETVSAAPPAKAKSCKASDLEKWEPLPNPQNGPVLGEQQVEELSRHDVLPKNMILDLEQVTIDLDAYALKGIDRSDVPVVDAAVNLLSSSMEAQQKPSAGRRYSTGAETVLNFWNGDYSAVAVDCEHNIPVVDREKADDARSKCSECVGLRLAVDGTNEENVSGECVLSRGMRILEGRRHISQATTLPSILLEEAPTDVKSISESSRPKIEPGSVPGATTSELEGHISKQDLLALPTECTTLVQATVESLGDYVSEERLMGSGDLDPCVSADECRVEDSLNAQDVQTITSDSLGAQTPMERQSSVGVEVSSPKDLLVRTAMRNSTSSDLGDISGPSVSMGATFGQVCPEPGSCCLRQTAGIEDMRPKFYVHVVEGSTQIRTPCSRLDSFADVSASQMLARVSCQLPVKSEGARLDGDDSGVGIADVRTTGASCRKPSETAARDLHLSCVQDHAKGDGTFAAGDLLDTPALTSATNETSHHGQLKKFPSELDRKMGTDGNGIECLSDPNKHSICQNDLGFTAREVEEPEVCNDLLQPFSEGEKSSCGQGFSTSVEDFPLAGHRAKMLKGAVEMSTRTVSGVLATNSDIEPGVRDVSHIDFEPKTDWMKDRAKGDSVLSKHWNATPQGVYLPKMASLLSPKMVETCIKVVKNVCEVSAERSRKATSERSAHEPITPFSLLRAVDGLERSSPVPVVPETEVLVVAPTPIRSATLLPPVGNTRSSSQKPSSSRKPSSALKPSSSRKPSSAVKPSSNLVASIRSFVPLIQQQAPPSFLPNAKRAVTVKALVAAEATKLKQEKRDQERAKRKRVDEDRSQSFEKERENLDTLVGGSLEESLQGRKLQGDARISGHQQQTGDRLPLSERVGLGDRVHSNARSTCTAPKLKHATGARMRIEIKAKKYEEEIKRKEEEMKRKEAKFLAWRQNRDQEREKKRQRPDNSLKMRRVDEDQHLQTASVNNSKITGQPSFTKVTISSGRTSPVSDPKKSTIRKTGSLQQHVNLVTSTTSTMHVKVNVGSDSGNSSLESPSPGPANKQESDREGPMSYEISPYVKSSDEEMEDDEDENEEQHRASAKPIPVWALKDNLMPQLLRQVHLNPEEIFAGSNTCSLTEVFATTRNCRYPDFSKRSSIDWTI